MGDLVGSLLDGQDRDFRVESAEPVAWYRINEGPPRKVELSTCPLDPAAWLPLYAAPGAGEDGVPRKALARLRECRAHGRIPIMDDVDAVLAALAPGGQPRCEVCGGHQRVAIAEWKGKLPTGATMPCPKCNAPAAGEAPDG